ncbi:MAG: hydrogenase nickel incorporation protein HypA [Thaumarchaeota archaeon]|nr:hydrogenase nickel incorporation protein HypA [Nitrososphaerota archaeon]
MHEWALAEALISTVIQVSKKEGLRKIFEIEVRIGELQDIDLEIFKFALIQLRPDYLKDAEFKFKIVKTKLKCRICGHEWSPRKDELDESVREAIHFIPEITHAYLRCPRCGSIDFDIIEGRGVWLEYVRGK